MSRNLLYKIQLMRISILRGDKNDFTKIMDKYKSALSHSTAKEILDLYKLADTKPLPYQRVNWKVIIFEELGYYFSGIDYENVSKEVLDLYDDWFEDKNPSITLVESLVAALKSNRDRLSHEKIVHFVMEVFNKKFSRFYYSIFDLLNMLNFSTMPRGLLSDLLLRVKEILGNKDSRANYPNLRFLFIRIRKSRDDFVSDIDGIVEEYYPEFYQQEYRLEVLPSERVIHIQRYLDSIRSRNKVQGKDGKYIGYMDNPYLTIKNIIEFGETSLSQDLLSQLLEEISNTLFSETQTYSEKINSVRLLLCLRRQEISRGYDWQIYYSNLKQNISQVEKGHSILFDQESVLLLRLHFVFLRITFGEDSLQEMLETLALINNSSNREIIDSLLALEEFLRFEKNRLVDSSLISLAVQYISAFCFHDSDDIRYHTVNVLYHLIESQYASFVVNRLAKMMDDNDFGVKLAIARQVRLIQQHSIETFNYVVAKAKIDNNYLVRKSVESISESGDVEK